MARELRRLVVANVVRGTVVAAALSAAPPFRIVIPSLPRDLFEVWILVIEMTHAGSRVTFPVIGVTLRVSQVDDAGNQVTFGVIEVTHAGSQGENPGSRVTDAGNQVIYAGSEVSPAGTSL